MMRTWTSYYLRYPAMEFNNVITPGCRFPLIRNKTFHLGVKPILKGSKIFQPVMKLIKFKEQTTQWLQKSMKLTKIHYAHSFPSASMCVRSCAHIYVSTCMYVCMVVCMSTAKSVERYS